MNAMTIQPGTSRRMTRTTVNFDSAAAVTLASVLAGEAVVGVWAIVDTAWDGNGTVNIGDGTAANGYLTDAVLDKGTTGWKGQERDVRGTLLWDAVNLHARDRIYTAADTVDATVVTGTSTTGSMRVFVEIARLL